MAQAQVPPEQVYRLRTIVEANAGRAKKSTHAIAQGHLPNALPQQKQGRVIALVFGADKGAPQFQCITALAEKFRLVFKERGSIEALFVILPGSFWSHHACPV